MDDISNAHRKARPRFDLALGIAKAIDGAEGIQKLAKALGVSAQAVHNWKLRGTIPAERAKDVAAATGVPLHELRPDLWDAP